MQAFIGMLGRWCLSIIFIIAGISKIFDWQGVEQSLVNAMCNAGTAYIHYEWMREVFEYFIPHVSVLLILGTAFEIIGGVLIFIGIQIRLGAFLLIFFLIPTTFLFHHFWLLQGSDRELQMIMFMKNVSIFGGLLLLLAYGKGYKKPKPVKAQKIED